AGEHRALAAGHEEGVEAVEVDLLNGPGVLDQLEEPGVVLEAAAEDVLGLEFAGVLGVANGGGLAGPALGANHFDLVAGFGELEVRMGQLGPPEADRPAGGGGYGRGGEDDGDPLGPAGGGGVQVLVAHGCSFGWV